MEFTNFDNEQSSQNIMATILKSLPKESGLTKIEYEGPSIALYSKNPRFLIENSQILSNMVNIIRKRVVIRSDESIRKSRNDSTRIIQNRLLPLKVKTTGIFFDDALGELTIYISNSFEMKNQIENAILLDLVSETGWKIKLRKSTVKLPTIQFIDKVLDNSTDYRIKFYKEVGDKVFRPKLSPSNFEASIVTLGGFGEIGRSCLLVVTKESKILLDCGINTLDEKAVNYFPRFDMTGFTLDEIDAVIITHAHIDHIGFLPFLYKYGYRGPVYCTEPTLPLMNLLQLDSVKISQNNGVYCPYEIRDVNEIIKHCITLPYGKPTDISPDITITLNNAGHIMGSATVHLNISGAHNILYSGDYKYAKTQLLDSAVSNYPRVETLITESTYGASNDLMPDQRVVYSSFTENINKTLSNGGKVLIPVPAVGRAQEIMLVLDKEMKEGRLIESPIYIEGMISEASAIHMSYAHYLGQDVRRSVSQGINPFQSEYFTVVNGWGKRDDVLKDQNPAIIMATSGMLEGGPSVEYFKEIATKENNKMIFVSYQINGTLGRRVLDGNTNEVSMMDKNGKVKVIPLRCKTQKIDGFSGHSDFNQILNFVSRIKPKRVLVNHGERTKSENTASTIYNKLGIRSSVPDNREILKLR